MNKNLSKFIGVMSVLFVITLLVLSGPADALSLEVSQPNNANSGSDVTFDVTVNIEDITKDSLQYTNILITGPNSYSKTCKVYHDGTDDCADVDITIDTTLTPSYGYGYGYGYYYDNLGTITYTAVWHTPSGLTGGTYTVKAQTISDLATYDSSSKDFQIIYVYNDALDADCNNIIEVPDLSTVTSLNGKTLDDCKDLYYDEEGVLKNPIMDCGNDFCETLAGLDGDSDSISSTDIGIARGTLEAQIVTGSSCGNKVIEGNEQCDGTATFTADCISQGFPLGGSLSCNADCTFNTGLCNVGSTGGSSGSSGGGSGGGGSGSSRKPIVMNTPLPEDTNPIEEPRTLEENTNNNLGTTPTGAFLGMGTGTILSFLAIIALLAGLIGWYFWKRN